MTNQEAFDRATIIHDTLTTGKDLTIKFNSKNVEWIIKAAEAIEKQIPKKPNEYYDGYADGNPVIEFECPNCGAELDADFDHHCRCGQSIDWSEVEE